MEWVDKTSYSRGDKERVPRTWEIGAGDARLVVTRRIHEEGWFMVCHGLNMGPVEMGDIPLSLALVRAPKLMHERLTALSHACDAYQDLNFVRAME